VPYRYSTVQYQNNRPTSSHRNLSNDTVSRHIYQQKLSHVKTNFFFVQTEAEARRHALCCCARPPYMRFGVPRAGGGGS